MEEKKVKQIRPKPIYVKTIDKRSSSGQITGQVTISLVPWEYQNEDTGLSYKGETIQIQTTKLGYGNSPGHYSRVTIDPKSKEIKEAIFDAYKKAQQ